MLPVVSRPFFDHLGFEIVEAEAGRAKVRMPANPHLANSRGDVHGGAITGLFDAALSLAARVSGPHVAGVATIQMTTHFLVPARGTLLATARVVGGGRTVLTVEGTATDEAGHLVAQALGSWRVLTKR